MVSCEVVTGKWTPIIGACLPPSTLEYLQEFAEALTHFRYQDPIVVGDLNSNVHSQNPCIQHVYELLMELLLVDL